MSRTKGVVRIEISSLKAAKQLANDIIYARMMRQNPNRYSSTNLEAVKAGIKIMK